MSVLAYYFTNERFSIIILVSLSISLNFSLKEEKVLNETCETFNKRGPQNVLRKQLKV